MPGANWDQTCLFRSRSRFVSKPRVHWLTAPESSRVLRAILSDGSSLVLPAANDDPCAIGQADQHHEVRDFGVGADEVGYVHGRIPQAKYQPDAQCQCHGLKLDFLLQLIKPFQVTLVGNDHPDTNCNIDDDSGSGQHLVLPEQDRSEHGDSHGDQPGTGPISKSKSIFLVAGSKAATISV